MKQVPEGFECKNPEDSMLTPAAQQEAISQYIAPNRRRHKKRAKKRRPVISTVPAPIIESLPLKEIVQKRVSKATLKRRERRKIQKKAFQSIEPAGMTLPVVSIQLPVQTPPMTAPEQTQPTAAIAVAEELPLARASPVLKRQHLKQQSQRFLLTATNLAQQSNHPDRHLIGLKSLFKSTGDVTRTPPDILDEVFFDQLPQNNLINMAWKSASMEKPGRTAESAGK